MLRARKLSDNPLSDDDSNTTAWQTSSGGTFVEPVQRPSLRSRTVTLEISLSRANYKLLEVLYDDVAAYASRLIASHVTGLVKSAEHNAKEKSKHDNAS